MLRNTQSVQSARAPRQPAQRNSLQFNGMQRNGPQQANPAHQMNSMQRNSFQSVNPAEQVNGMQYNGQQSFNPAYQVNGIHHNTFQSVGPVYQVNNMQHNGYQPVGRIQQLNGNSPPNEAPPSMHDNTMFNPWLNVPEYERPPRVPGPLTRKVPQPSSEEKGKHLMNGTQVPYVAANKGPNFGWGLRYKGKELSPGYFPPIHDDPTIEELAEYVDTFYANVGEIDEVWCHAITESVNKALLQHRIGIDELLPIARGGRVERGQPSMEKHLKKVNENMEVQFKPETSAATKRKRTKTPKPAQAESHATGSTVKRGPTASPESRRSESEVSASIPELPVVTDDDAFEAFAISKMKAFVNCETEATSSVAPQSQDLNLNPQAAAHQPESTQPAGIVSATSESPDLGNNIEGSNNNDGADANIDNTGSDNSTPLGSGQSNEYNKGDDEALMQSVDFNAAGYLAGIGEVYCPAALGHSDPYLGLLPMVRFGHLVYAVHNEQLYAAVVPSNDLVGKSSRVIFEDGTIKETPITQLPFHLIKQKTKTVFENGKTYYSFPVDPLPDTPEESKGQNAQNDLNTNDSQQTSKYSFDVISIDVARQRSRKIVNQNMEQGVCELRAITNLSKRIFGNPNKTGSHIIRRPNTSKMIVLLTIYSFREPKISSADMCSILHRNIPNHASATDSSKVFQWNEAEVETNFLRIQCFDRNFYSKVADEISKRDYRWPLLYPFIESNGLNFGMRDRPTTTLGLLAVLEEMLSSAARADFYHSPETEMRLDHCSMRTASAKENQDNILAPMLVRSRVPPPAILGERVVESVETEDEDSTPEPQTKKRRCTPKVPNTTASKPRRQETPAKRKRSSKKAAPSPNVTSSVMNNINQNFLPQGTVQQPIQQSFQGLSNQQEGYSQQMSPPQMASQQILHHQMSFQQVAHQQAISQQDLRHQMSYQQAAHQQAVPQQDPYQRSSFQTSNPQQLPPQYSFPQHQPQQQTFVQMSQYQQNNAPLALQAPPKRKQKKPQQTSSQFTFNQQGFDNQIGSQQPIAQQAVLQTASPHHTHQQAPLYQQKTNQQLRTQQSQNQRLPAQQPIAVPQQHSAEQYAPQEYALQQPDDQQPAIQQPVAQQPATEQSPVEQSPVGQSPLGSLFEESLFEEFPDQQTPVQQAPVQQAPVQQAPVQQAPVQQALEQQPPVQQSPVQQSPEQQLAVQQTAAVQTAAQQTAPPLTPPTGHCDLFSPVGVTFDFVEEIDWHNPKSWPELEAEDMDISTLFNFA